MENLQVVILIVFVLGIITLFGLFVTIKQGSIGVITVFGKFRRILRPGLNIRIPLIENIHSRVSVQNQSVELSFQATTLDQANVNFKPCFFFPY
jgi:regulator of protease activity HflC (stomatin/prohibitin superfamily)